VKTRRIVGIVLCLIGLVWFFQGLDVIKGSFMTGQIIWTIIGAAVIFAGVSLIRGSRQG
jgi:uncharacterized membrane protein YeaQ/YmgE (transglycosylase-associated protein family)